MTTTDIQTLLIIFHSERKKPLPLVEEDVKTLEANGLIRFTEKSVVKLTPSGCKFIAKLTEVSFG